MDVQVKSRKPQCEWLRLGVQGDNNVELVRFILPRFTSNHVDLYFGMSYIGFVLPDGSEHLISISEDYKEVTEDSVALTWVVGREATAQPGRIAIAIKISGLEGELWKSEKAYCTVADTIPMESTQPEIFRSANVPSNVVVLPRITNPDTEPPITISERTIIVPQELQNIAVQNDQNSETVKIVCPRYFDGNDLSQYDFYLHTISTGGENPDIVFLGENKVVGQTEVTLVWTLKPPETSYAGRLTIQLKISGINFQWSTDSTSVNIIHYQEGDPVIPVTPSFVDEFLKEITIIKNSAKESQVAANASEKNAETSATNSKNSANESKKFSDSAAESANNAKTSKENADAAALAAKTSETKAAASMESAKDEVDKAKNEADRAKNEADRSKAEADRAAGIVGGDFANKVKDATAGNLVVLTAVGDIADSGKGLDDVGKVKSVFGRDGDVVAEDGDYAAAQVSCVPAKVIQEENVQGAINYISDHYLPEKIDEFVIKPSNPQDYTAPLACLLRPSFVGRTVQDGTPSPESPAPIRGVLNPWARAYTGEPVQVAADVEPMMALPDGTADRIVLRDGTWGIERTVIKIILNGNSDWQYFSENNYTIDNYFVELPEIVPNQGEVIYCDTLMPVRNNINAPNYSVHVGSGYHHASIGVHLPEEAVPRNDIQAMKTWANAHPITVYCRAATPTFEPIPAWNGYGKIDPITVTTTITKPNPDAPISPDNVATITGTPVVTTGYRGQARQLAAELFDGDRFEGVNLDLKIKKIVFDGTENWYNGGANNDYYVVLGYSWSPTANGKLVSNYFVPADSWENLKTTPGTMIVNLGDGNLCVNYDNAAGGSDNFKAKLAEWASAGQPLEVVYELAAPTITRHDLDLPLAPGDWIIECGDDNGLLESVDVTVLPDPDTYGNRIYPYTHVKAGNVHRLTGTPGAMEISFAATATYQDGDTWTLNGAPVAVTYAGGQALLPTAVIMGESVRAMLEDDVMRPLIQKPTPQANTLINAIFDSKHLVNQRGQITYTAGYGIDMWNAELNTEVKLHTNAIEIICLTENIGSDSGMIQKLENASGQYTYAIEVSEVVGFGWIFIQNHTEGALRFTSPGIYTGTFENVQPGEYFYIRAGAGSKVKVATVKLEPGPRFTGWDTSKPGEALAECQRYQFAPWREGGNQCYIGSVRSNGGNICYGLLRVPVTLRTVPVIARGPKDLYYWGTINGAFGQRANVTAARIFEYTNNGVHVEYVLDVALSPGDSGLLYAATPGPDALLLDCNL